MISQAIKKVVDGQDLSFEEAIEAMNEIMEGKATDAQIAALIVGLRMKGETVEEISAFAKVMRDKAVPIKPKAKVVVDTCGTGGDVSDTFNVSTVSAFVVAGAGVPVAKHGNRSVSSSCGSADLLEGLGVKIDVEPAVVEQAIDEIGIGFMFAPKLHKAMKYAIGPRKEIGVRTVFNILGPLTNPARATSQLLGVYDPQLTELMAEVLGNLGSQHALVVHGEGLDELTTAGVSKVSELKDGEVTTYEVDVECLGIQPTKLENLQAKTLEDNLKIARDVLAGNKGPTRDIVVLNSAAALVAADKTNSIAGALSLAENSIDSGAAQEKLDLLIKFTQAN
jgi:anthranilate phosphoribosyltransferase